MDALLKIIGGLALAAALLFAACLASTCVGAIGGLIVGLCFHDTLIEGQRAFHIGVPAAMGDGLPRALEPWQLGAFLGFVGAFFKSIMTAPAKG